MENENNENIAAEDNYLDKILVADRSILARQTIVETLKDNGMNREEFIEADNGMTAIEILKQNKIDLIFLEWQMADMDGLEIVKMIKQTTKYNQVPIIMLLTKSNQSRINELLNQDIQDYLIKPFNKDTFWEKMVNILLFHKKDLSLRSPQLADFSHPFIEKLLSILSNYDVDPQGKTILVCTEDDEYWHNLTHKQGLPLEVMLKSKYREAIQVVEDRHPPLIFLDYHFLKSKFDIFLEKIREYVLAYNIYILLTIDNDEQLYRITEEKKEKYEKLGVIDYVNKVSDFKQMYEFIGHVLVAVTVPYEKLGKLVHISPAFQSITPKIQAAGKKRALEKDKILQGGDVGIIADKEIGIKLDVKNAKSLEKDRLKFKTFQGLFTDKMIPNTFTIDFTHYTSPTFNRRDFEDMFKFTEAVPDFQTNDVIIVIPPEKKHLKDFFAGLQVTKDYLVVDTIKEAFEFAKIRNASR